MSTRNIQLHDKIRKFHKTKIRKYFFFFFFFFFYLLSYVENFVGTRKQVRIIHGKQAIGVRAIEVRLYILRVPVHKLAVIFLGTCHVLKN